jgi:rhodanese-related sulfurtransferase
MPLADALALLDRNEAVLIDVRSREAYAEGHIPGAVNIASNEIEDQAAAIRKMSRLPILYCG